MHMAYKLCSFLTKGDLCPAGHYCPEGSSSGTPCPPGTQLSSTGAQDVSECNLCNQGSYCGGYGNSVATGPCDAGYYCPQGMNTSAPMEYTCPQGW